jgi:2-oxoisovalerate dehydrogenase E1 component
VSSTRPVIEIMYLDFIAVCLDQLVNQAAKLPYMTGGGAEVPLTVRTQFGGGRSSGAQHSQSLEAILAHIPGLTVAMPSTPADAYGLLRAAIADPNPVIFIEHRHLYDKKGPAPDPDHMVPLGSARIAREGTDVTIVSISRMVDAALAAAEALADGGIDAEVIDLRTVAPLDSNAVLASVTRTNRLVIAHEAVTDFGIGAELAARLADAGFWELDAPIKRVGAAAVPPPYAPELEHAWLPDAKRIEAAVREVLDA